MLGNVIFGTAAAIKRGEWQHSMAFFSIMKKAGTILFMQIMTFTANVSGGQLGIEQLSETAILAAFCIPELISLVRNYKACGMSAGPFEFLARERSNEVA